MLSLTMQLRRGRIVAVCVALGLSAAAAGCGSSSSSSSSTASASSAATTVGASSNSTSNGVTYAKGQVAKYSNLLTTFSPPGPPLQGLKGKLSGKTVWYIPVFLQAPIFTADATDIAQPLALAGATVHICDAGSNPSQATSCINEAVKSNAAAIVTDAMNDSFASSAYAAAIAAKIPVVATDNDNSVGFPKSPLLTTVSLGTPEDARLAADWIIANSNGKADVVYAADNSNDGVIEAAATKDEFTKYCPGCKYTAVSFGDLSIQNLATAISSAMDKDPNINYVDGGYDAPSGIYALQGAKTVTGRHFTYITSTGQPPGLQRVADGQQAADPGLDTDDAMWNTADALFRILTGAKPVASYTPALRIFTKSNVPSNTKDAGAYASGQWYTNGTFKAMYQKLWGL
jgi:ribose transport system substrate-binding protein